MHSKGTASAAFFTVCGVSLTHQILNLVIGFHFLSQGNILIGMGVHLSAFSFGAILARIILALFLRHIRPIRQIRVGMVLVFIADISYLYVSHNLTVTAIRMIQGIGFGLAGTAAPTLMTYLAENTLLNNVNRYGTAVSLASVLGQCGSLCLMYVIPNYGFAICTALSAATACAVIVLSFCLPSSETDTLHESSGVTRITVWKSLKKSKGKLISFCLILCVQNGCISLLPVQSYQNGSILPLTAFMLLSTVSGLLIRPFIPTLFQKYGKRVSMGAVAALYAIALLFLSDSVSSTLLAGILQGILGTLTMTFFHWWLLDGAPNQEHPVLNLLNLLCVDAGMILCGYVWAIADYFLGNSHSIYLNVGALLLMAVGLIISGKKLPDIE